MSDLSGKNTIKRIFANMPTEDKLDNISGKWYSEIEKVSFLSWNPILDENSIPYWICKGNYSILSALLKEGKNRMPDDQLAEIMHEYIKEGLFALNCAGNFFAKLISRSPKDFLFDEGRCGMPRPLKSAKDLVQSFSCSMRIFEDLIHLERANPYGGFLVLRPYLSWEPWQEWRCFIRNRQVVGVSQYYHEHSFPQLITSYTSNVFEKISFAAYDWLIPNMKADDFVADFTVIGGKITLIETNPFYLSDPCLFESHDKFDKSIRIKS